MQKARLILIMGIWIALLPYLGFPYFLKNILFSATGLIFVYLSFLLYKDYKNSQTKKKIKTFDNFSENIDFSSKDDSQDRIMPV